MNAIMKFKLSDQKLGFNLKRQGKDQLVYNYLKIEKNNNHY
jgi:hypothetical protein